VTERPAEPARNGDAGERGPPLEVRDVTLSRGGVTVLDGVSLAARRGSVVGLVGPNGAGKTTLLGACNGSLAPDDGAVFVEGERASALSAREAARRVATLPQSTALDFAFSVRETVAMGRTPHVPRLGREDASDREAVETAMERASVSDLADRPVTEVSGGERARVLLARALAQDTPVLLLDEPTASLDVNHQVRTLSLVRDLTADGRTVVAAIHDLDLAARFCDRLALLADGRVRAVGPPEAVLTEATLRDAFGVAARVGTDPATGSPRVTALAGRDAEGSEAPTGRVHVVGTGGAAASALSALRAAGHDLTAGPLPRGGESARTARVLDVEAVTAPPFEALAEATLDRLRAAAENADAVVVVGAPPGADARAVRAATRGADRIVRVADPLEDSGVDGRARLPDDARAVPPDEVVGAVATALARGTAGVTSPVEPVDGGGDD
jgi:iron complex transport system ATP-binding protein